MTTCYITSPNAYDELKRFMEKTRPIMRRSMVDYTPTFIKRKIIESGNALKFENVQREATTQQMDESPNDNSLALVVYKDPLAFVKQSELPSADSMEEVF
ncbi:hypothetical protein EIN_018220 [Entamoeba invadens IP1]|uniref:hypothetical protein n=1 Tax=Entamoeba invadens IP1 TaxID=370355 RepID=UPI0002C3F0C2|nr:hypothetical protein EIN_018220 [Entamoeba invadens IP1]ELP90473.1 hypothetical protein EIN_018220 [Entamoeba invadens IP1]|eukprot:XP_004257244.1 hypothetical protein EIN_018220 [Entamoeba invadens IP1]